MQWFPESFAGLIFTVAGIADVCTDDMDSLPHVKQ